MAIMMIAKLCSGHLLCGRLVLSVFCGSIFQAIKVKVGLGWEPDGGSVGDSPGERQAGAFWKPTLGPRRGRPGSRWISEGFLVEGSCGARGGLSDLGSPQLSFPRLTPKPAAW